MGKLIRGIMKDQRKDAFFKNLIFKPDMIPELILLGTLEHREVPMDDGRMFAVDIILYEGKQYIMKQEEVDRWFDQR